MPIRKQLNDGKVPVKIYTEDIDIETLIQLKQISELDIIFSHVAAMPDVHLGIGATVGAVIPTKSAIIPAAVGVDIGCGMNAVRLSIKSSSLPDNLRKLRFAIEAAIPVGFSSHKDLDLTSVACNPLETTLYNILEKHPDIYKKLKNEKHRWRKQMGTLGSGNHFIELCIDENDYIWLMLHSGSRGIGNAIGTHFIQLAKKDMQKHIRNLPNKDLAYFKEGSSNFNDYMHAVNWAQQYAYNNRKLMMKFIVEAITPFLPTFSVDSTAVNCHHNYVSEEVHFDEKVLVTRKGAISAKENQLGIIPGSMGTKSYIVCGKGCLQSFQSCSHGAGRKMSRSKAKKIFTKADLVKQTLGIECRKDKDVIDEIPSAYKDIDVVMANQSDLVDIVHILKQIICIKG